MKVGLSTVATWLTTTAAGAGTLATALGVLRTSLLAIAPSLGALGAFFAGCCLVNGSSGRVVAEVMSRWWQVGKVLGDLDLFDGKLKTLGETFGAAKWLQWLGLAEKVDDADLELAISSRRAAEEQKNLGAAVEQTARGPGGFEALSAAVKAADAELAKLSVTQRKELTADARLTEGAFEKLPAHIKDLGAQWDQQQLAEKMQELAEKTRKTELELRKLGATRLARS